MMVRTTCWSALLTVALLASTPAWAQADEEEPESPAEIDETTDDDQADEPAAEEDAEIDDDDADEADEPAVEEQPEIDDDDADEAGEPTDEDEAEPELDEEADSVDEPGVEEEPELDDDADSVVEEEAGDDDALEAPPEDEWEVSDEEYEEPVGGFAFAPAYAEPETGIRVLGNVEDGDPWIVDIGGYIRGGYTYIEADPDYELFGRNDGFTLADARFIMRGEMDYGLGFVMSLDAGSRLVRTTPDSPVEELAVRMTDTYAYFAPYDFIELNLGQFKAPFDVEDLISTSNLLFINRSVANRGVQDVEGFNVAGMSQGRQIGLQARGEYAIVGDDNGPMVSYAAAVANGNGPNQSMNENDRLAYYGRLAFHWGDIVSLGGAAFHNDRSFGDPPNQVDRTTWGWTADLTANFEGASLLANVVNETREVPEIEQDPETTGLGYQLQVAYEEPYFGIQPAYRFAVYDPTYDHGGEGPDDFFDEDSLTYHTIGLNYNAQSFPLRLMANYTITVEESDTRSLENDRLDLMLQLQW